MMRAMAEARWEVQVQSRPEKVGSRLLSLLQSGFSRKFSTRFATAEKPITCGFAR
jgi:hypothetical protein